MYSQAEQQQHVCYEVHCHAPVQLSLHRIYYIVMSDFLKIGWRGNGLRCQFEHAPRAITNLSAGIFHFCNIPFIQGLK